MAPTRVTDDYYAILGIEATATAQAIRTAYHKLAKVTHPDRNPSPDGKEQFQKLQAAYETLSDSKKRKEYDAVRPRKPCYSQWPWNTSPPSQAEYKEARDHAHAQTRLAMLRAQWIKDDRDIFKAKQDIKRLDTELAKLEEQETADEKDWVRRTPWLGSIAAALFGIETVRYRETKEARDRRRLDRVAAIHIKIQEREMRIRRLGTLENTVYILDKEIQELKRETQMNEWSDMARKANEAQARAKMREERMKRAREAQAAREQGKQQQNKEEEEQREREPHPGPSKDVGTQTEPTATRARASRMCAREAGRAY